MQCTSTKIYFLFSQARAGLCCLPCEPTKLKTLPSWTYHIRRVATSQNQQFLAPPCAIIKTHPGSPGVNTSNCACTPEISEKVLNSSIALEAPGSFCILIQRRDKYFLLRVNSFQVRPHVTLWKPTESIGVPWSITTWLSREAIHRQIDTYATKYISLLHTTNQ